MSKEQESIASITGIKLRHAKPIRLFEQAVEQIKKLINNGQLKPGDKLPSENELGQLLNVSRSSVREALRALESNGLIQVRSGAGAFISDDALMINAVNEATQRLVRRQHLVIQLLQVRGAIECMLVAQAADLISTDQIAELDSLIRQQESVIYAKQENFMEELSELDTKFHLAISNVSNNDIAREIIYAIISSFQEDNKTIFYFEKGIMMVAEHRQILESLSDHDAGRAEGFMRDHIQRVMNEIQGLI